MSATNDDKARQAVRERLAESLFVEAGAGTGKTTTLVERAIAHIVDEGLSVTQVVAITFTRAAAAELRYRVRQRLEQLRVMGTLKPVQLERVGQALRHLQDAPIQTIDAFSTTLITGHLNALGMPPDVELLDETEYIEFRENRWRIFLQRQFKQRSQLADACASLTRLGFKRVMGRFKEVAIELDVKRTALDFWSASPIRPFNTQASRRFWDTACATNKAVLQATGMGGGDSLWQRLNDGVQPLLEQLATTDPQSAEYDYLLSRTFIFKPNLQLGQKPNWSWLMANEHLARQIETQFETTSGLKGKQLIADFLRSLFNQAHAEHAARANSACGKILPMLVDFVIEFAEHRRSTGKLWVADSIVMALELLKKYPETLADYRKNYPVILVDEFQDTSPEQIELIELLAGASGRMFLVGDPKQSIYGFRDAEPTCSFRIRDQFAESGQLLRLARNFRSRQNILDFVNSTFAMRMQSEGEEQAEYSALEHSADIKGQALVHCLNTDQFATGNAVQNKTASQLSKKPNAREFQANLAQRVVTIANLAQAGGLQVRDMGTGQTRPSRLVDVCVLVRSRTNLEALTTALAQAGIRYVLDSKSQGLHSQTARELRNLLAAVADPTDLTSIVATLRSPVFGCSDLNLLKWRQSGGIFNYLAQPHSAPSEGLVGEGLKTLANFHRLSLQLWPSELLEQMVRQLQLRQIILAENPQNCVDIGQVDSFIDTVVELQQKSIHSLLELVLQFDRRTELRTTSQTFNDALYISTIHFAKGLEFPIVVVTDFSKSKAKNEQKAQYILRDGVKTVVEWSLKHRHSQDLDWHSRGFEEAKDIKLRRARLENTRVLYVACTRARDHLFVYTGDIAGRPQLDLREPVLADLPPRKQKQYRQFDQAAWHAERECVLENTRPPAGLTVTQDSDADGEQDSRPNENAMVGRAVHSVLQFAFKGDSDIGRLCRHEARRQGAANQTTKIESLVNAVLGSEIAARARSAARLWTEVPVATNLPKGVLRGRIDLLFQNPAGELIAVDYKTDRLDSTEELDRHTKQHATQLGNYAFALEHITGTKVAEAWLLFADHTPKGRATAVQLPNLTQLKATAQAKLLGKGAVSAT